MSTPRTRRTSLEQVRAKVKTFVIGGEGSNGKEKRVALAQAPNPFAGQVPHEEPETNKKKMKKKKSKNSNVNSSARL